MASDIDRLERQARILADLKGVSINDLKYALQSACEAEAHGELRALVGTLQARVEGLQLGGVGGSGGGRQRVLFRGQADAPDNIPSQDQFNEEVAARARTALELRIGELEEIEVKQKEELDSLYTKSQAMTQKNTMLETQNMQQKALLEQLELRWKVKEEDDVKRSSITPTAAATGSYNYSEFALPAMEAQPILLHNTPPSLDDAELEQRIIAAESALAGEQSHRLLVQSQFDSARDTYELKIDQHKHRIQFLYDQLQDLELQMTSLYTAFGIIQNDNNEEKSEKEAWKRYLVESDAALAKEESIRETKQQSPPTNVRADYDPSPVVSSVVSPEFDRSSRRRREGSGGIFAYPLSPPSSKMDSPPSSLVRASVKPTVHTPIVAGRLLLLLDNASQPISHSDGPSPLTPRSKSFSARKLIPMKSTPRPSNLSAGNKFKMQYCVLHGANGLYQVRYGDTYEGPVGGVHEFITVGVSSIEHTSRTSNQPFGFEIMINAFDMDSPVLCCAAESEDDFMMWMSALTSVIDGSLDDPGYSY